MADIQSDVVDWSIFSQILLMDEDENLRDFSKSIVENYFEQAESTFTDMDAALDQQDYDKLMRLGHFLKGSSASLGLVKVQATCEDIQHVDVTYESPHVLLARLREEYIEAHRWLNMFFQK
ncbi:Ypd1 protein [Starmerella bacillaris]|uniref:Ypd1 protein n=1 Tax=Starmerella bacillaris TaxID=1247836 RepID=A0AAV5RGX4_STABA|nr:Ypd1 protein [Starmerella bacillaris]